MSFAAASTAAAIGSSVVAAITKAAKSASHISKTKKKKTTFKKNSKSKPKINTNLSARDVIRSVDAPVASGLIRTKGLSTKPFEVPSSLGLVQAFTSVTSPYPLALNTISAALNLTNASGNVCCCLGQTQTANSSYPSVAGAAIAKLASAFTQYRVKPGSAKLYYSTVLATTTPGAIALSASPPEFPTVVNNIPFNNVRSQECSVTCPVWSPYAEFPRKKLNDILGTDWHWCDFDGTVDQGELRQDAFINLQIGQVGVTATGTTLGVVTMDCILQFRHLNDGSDFTNLASDTPSSNSSSLHPSESSAPSSSSSSSTSSYTSSFPACSCPLHDTVVINHQ
jgi:hypothetical protein